MKEKCSKKGISPLIAAVLLIVMAVAIAGVIIAWMSAYTKDTQADIGDKSADLVDCKGALIAIDSVYLSNGTAAASARAIVKNVGIHIDNLQITTGVVFNTSGSSFAASNLPITDFDKGDIEIVTFANMSVGTCEDFSQVIVGTNCPDANAHYSGRPIC
jgi:flagellin-like protein